MEILNLKSQISNVRRQSLISEEITTAQQVGPRDDTKETSLREAKRRGNLDQPSTINYGQIVSLNISQKKGQKKKPVDSFSLIKGKGIEGDAHFGSDRQVSLLPVESIKKMQELGLKVSAGSFAENITTQGIDLPKLVIGTRLKFGEVLVKITHIGKDCHAPCAIYKQAGYCVMPQDGVFAKVLVGGKLKTGDKIEVGV